MSSKRSPAFFSPLSWRRRHIAIMPVRHAAALFVRKGAHQYRGQFPGDATRIVSDRQICKGGRQHVLRRPQRLNVCKGSHEGSLPSSCSTVPSSSAETPQSAPLLSTFSLTGNCWRFASRHNYGAINIAVISNATRKSKTAHLPVDLFGNIQELYVFFTGSSFQALNDMCWDRRLQHVAVDRRPGNLFMLATFCQE